MGNMTRECVNSERRFDVSFVAIAIANSPKKRRVGGMVIKLDNFCRLMNVKCPKIKVHVGDQPWLTDVLIMVVET